MRYCVSLLLLNLWSPSLYFLVSQVLKLFLNLCDGLIMTTWSVDVWLIIFLVPSLQTSFAYSHQLCKQFGMIYIETNVYRMSHAKNIKRRFYSVFKWWKLASTRLILALLTYLFANAISGWGKSHSGAKFICLQSILLSDVCSCRSPEEQSLTCVMYDVKMFASSPR